MMKGNDTPIASQSQIVLNKNVRNLNVIVWGRKKDKSKEGITKLLAHSQNIFFLQRSALYCKDLRTGVFPLLD